MDENGTVQDDYRIEFVRDHLEWIAKAIEDGANCLGYHYWGVLITGHGVMLLKTDTDLFVYVLMMVINVKKRNQLHGLEKLLELMNLNKREGVYQV